jgi:hypothetical protein
MYLCMCVCIVHGTTVIETAEGKRELYHMSSGSKAIIDYLNATQLDDGLSEEDDGGQDEW